PPAAGAAEQDESAGANGTAGPTGAAGANGVPRVVPPAVPPAVPRQGQAPKVFEVVAAEPAQGD
ncbi:MAG TPA: hypothetical protein DEP69_05950, partial [Acidimicrobiaceae bacterium]|nr:hypothetical protein [Acidimicrobiaceae bacterium]